MGENEGPKKFLKNCFRFDGFEKCPQASEQALYQFWRKTTTPNLNSNPLLQSLV